MLAPVGRARKPPLMIATVAAFIEVAVIGAPLVKSSVLPATLITAGAVVSPPMLLKVTLASVLS